MEKLRFDVTYGNTFPETHPIEHLRAELHRQRILTAQEIKTTLPNELQARKLGWRVFHEKKGPGPLHFCDVATAMPG